MWQNCWTHSISKLVGTKLILVISGWFWKPIDVAIGVGTLILGK
jgi:hypothetical protein